MASRYAWPDVGGRCTPRAPTCPAGRSTAEQKSVGPSERADGASPAGGQEQFDRLPQEPSKDKFKHQPFAPRLRYEEQRFQERGRLELGGRSEQLGGRAAR